MRTLGLICLLGVFFVFFAGKKLQQWGHEPLALSSEKVFVLKPGMTLSQLSSLLVEKEIVTQSRVLFFYVRIFRSFERFQAGQYRAEGTMTLDRLLDQIEQGHIYQPLVLEFSIPEGFRLVQILARLEALGVVVSGKAHEGEFIQTLGIHASSLEGFLYPATYRFYDVFPTETAVLKKMVEEFFSRIPAQYPKEVEAKGLTLEEAVNFASLIEREAFAEEEKPRISEVIWNRLHHKIPLGIDAALLYVRAEEDIRDSFTYEELQDRKNPYNTRVYRGLPPSPICSPSLSSLEAVLHPTNEGLYYYVLLPDGSKRHVFSRSLKEHNRHVQELVHSRLPTKPGGKKKSNRKDQI